MLKDEKKLKVCYFGNYFPDFSRNRIYQRGLRLNGVEIIECYDRTRGWRKFWRLWQNHRKLKDGYDIMVVGYPGQIVTPWAKLISKKKVVLDALCSLYEGEIISRRSAGHCSLKSLRIWLIDFFAYLFADYILVETEAQKKFFIKTFFVRPDKMRVVYTGADDEIFHPDSTIKKRDKFTAVFRGRFLPEAGVDVIIRAAKILEDNDVNFLIIGGGLLLPEINQLIAQLTPRNILLEDRYLPYEEINKLMLSCHVSLGQFANHERLERTIPHKAFESLGLGLPYLTACSAGVREVFENKENSLITDPANPAKLAESLILLKENTELRREIAERGYQLYQKKFSPLVLGRILYGMFQSFVDTTAHTDQPFLRENKNS